MNTTVNIVITISILTGTYVDNALIGSTQTEHCKQWTISFIELDTHDQLITHLPALFRGGHRIRWVVAEGPTPGADGTRLQSCSGRDA